MHYGASPMGAAPYGAGLAVSEIVHAIMTAAIETLHAERAASAMPREQIRPVVSSNAILAESLLTSSSAHSLVVESLRDARSIGLANLESLLTLRAIGDVDAEAGHGIRAIAEFPYSRLMDVDVIGNLVTEARSRISAIGLLPAEWGGGVLVEAIGLLPLDLLAGQRAVGPLPYSTLREEDAVGKSPVATGREEQSIGSSPVDRLRRLTARGEGAAEHLLSAAGIGTMLSEWAGEVAIVAVGEMPIDNVRAMQAATQFFRIEWLHGEKAEASAPIESLLGVFGDAVINAENLRAVQVSTECMAEFLLAMEVDSEMSAEILRGDRALMVAPVEWGGREAFLVGVTKILTMRAKARTISAD